MITIGVDIGTTTITCLAWDFEQRRTLCSIGATNTAETTSTNDKRLGYSEWNAQQMVEDTIACLGKLVDKLQTKAADVAGIGITGQQHGVVILDNENEPLTPLVNWQDRRAEQTASDGTTFVDHARKRLGESAPEHMGCRIAPGYMGMTLFWWKEHNQLPTGTCCFITDYFASALTEARPKSDSTMGASSGLLNVNHRRWDEDALAALELPKSLFPDLDEPTSQLGGLTSCHAEATGLKTGLPVFVGMGDNQAAFVGSVADPKNSLLVNVGTGGQVGAWCNRFVFQPPLETRPFPVHGNLLVNAGLCGGRSYAALERFFTAVGEQLFGIQSTDSLFTKMNQLAAQVAAGSDGLVCSPLFTGTRSEPHLRASFGGADPENFTPAHMTRALLEGMVEVFCEGGERIQSATGHKYTKLVGAGNGLRENEVLADMLTKAMQRDLMTPKHREEAAVGAALVAGVGCGICSDLDDAAKQIA